MAKKARHTNDYKGNLILPDIMIMAAIFGLNEGLLIRQIHYWTQPTRCQNFINDRYWVYNSYPEWQKQFSFWSIDTLQRTFQKIEQQELILVDNFNSSKINRTKWYSLDYEKLEMIIKDAGYSLEATESSITAKCHDHDRKNLRPSPQNPMMYIEHNTTTDTLSLLSLSELDEKMKDTVTTILDALCQQVGEDVYESWFKDLSILSCNDDILTMKATSQFSCREIPLRFWQEMDNAVQCSGGLITKIEVVA